MPDYFNKNMGTIGSEGPLFGHQTHFQTKVLFSKLISINFWEFQIFRKTFRILSEISLMGLSKLKFTPPEEFFQYCIYFNLR